MYYVRWSVPAVTAVWLLDCVRQVAKALNADMILVANGGLGSAYDELELNRGICEKYGIKVRGVVLNKVDPCSFVGLGFVYVGGSGECRQLREALRGYAVAYHRLLVA